MSRPINLERLLLALVVLAGIGVVALAFYDKYVFQPTTTILQPAPEVSKLETKTIQPKQVVVLESKAKEKLKLPKAIQKDSKQHVVSSSKVDYSLVPKTVTTLFDEDTGQFTTLEQDAPRPIVAAKSSGSVSLAYGFRDGQQITRVSVRQDLLSVKALDLGATAHIDSDGQHFIGLAATYRW